MRFDPTGLSALDVSGLSDFALHRYISLYGCVIDVRLVMSTFKIETLNDWEWGLRAAARLIWSHRPVIVPLALIMVVFYLALAPLEGVMAIQSPFSLPRIREFDLKDIIDTIVGAAFIVAITTIFLKSAGLKTSWRTRALAVFGIIGFELLAVLMLSIYDISKEAVEHPVLEAIIWLTMVAALIAWLNYAFCFAVQILVDGKVNLSRSFKGVARREWRLWLSMALMFVALFPVFLLQFGMEMIGDLYAPLQTILPHVETVIDACFSILIAVTFGALSTIWFLHPRVRPPEESTTWEVPTITQPS